MVLEKTLESPLDCKEIQPVYPEGNQSCIFISSSSCGARGGFLPRHDEDLREPLVRRQGSQAGDLRELARVPLRGEGSCGGGGALPMNIQD